MSANERSRRSLTDSYSFILRLWHENMEGDNFTWRGRIQDLKNGDVRYFSDWSAMKKILLEMLTDLTNNNTTRDKNN